MGIINIYRPQFLSACSDDIKMHKLMFVKKSGKALSKTGDDISRDEYDAELICISNETEADWVGNYAEGIGFFGVKFAKEDCRDATDEEVQAWIKDSVNFKY